MQKKDADIIIPTYNRKNTLQIILETLKKQTTQNFNVIITDDGSKELINPNHYPFIKKYIWTYNDGFNKVNRLNEAIQMCVSDKIILVDDDCIPLYETFVQTHVDTLNEFDVSRGIIFFQDRTVAEDHFSSANMGFKADKLKNLGGFDPNFNGSYGYEDVDLGLRVNEAKYETSLFYRDTSVLHVGDMGKRSIDEKERNRKYMSQKWGAEYDQF